MTELTQYSPSSDTEQVVCADDRIDQLVSALNDTKSRRILSETAQEALSADEISGRCDIPLSTVYRKLEQLVDAGMLVERVRLSSHPDYTREYLLDVTAINVDIGGESGVSLVVSRRSPSPEPPDQSTQSMSAD